MQSISVRVPEDDLEWLMALDIAGAKNPSDRIRSLISATRRQREGSADYVSCVAMLRDFMRPFVDGVRAAERQHKIHSEVVAAVADGLPEIMAETIAFPGELADDEAPAALRHIEADLAARTMRMLIRLLRLSITQNIPAYDASVLEGPVAEVIEIADLIRGRRNLPRSPPLSINDTQRGEPCPKKP
jgi:hypothetical protein